MAKGDSIRVYVRTSNGSPVLEQEIVAQQNGRTVEQTFEKDGNVQWLVITERTRGGTVMDEARFQASDVIALRRHIRDR